MRILNALGIVAMALLTASCSGVHAEAHGTRAPVPRVSPTPSPTAAVAPSPDPKSRVEAGSLARCDAQGVAQYPEGFVAQRTSAAPEGVWEGDLYRLSYPATVTLPPVTPDLPPEQRLVKVDCAVAERSGGVVVISWSAT
ncbi:hypothetical protein [Microbacterium azadirachtae]|uniref:hypothetical protein n=1 Tax=Microbacterium azadirachtae TaxID=582680 RepID=UPI003F74D077